MFGPSSLFLDAFDPFNQRGRHADPFHGMHRMMDDMFNDPFFAGAGFFPAHQQPPRLYPGQVGYASDATGSPLPLLKAPVSTEVHGANAGTGDAESDSARHNYRRGARRG